MPYSPTGLGIRGIRLSGGPQIYTYKTTDPVAVVDATGYWTNAGDRGVQAGDFVFVEQLANGDVGTVHRFIKMNGIIGSTQQFGAMHPEAINVLTYVLQGLAFGPSFVDNTPLTVAQLPTPTPSLAGATAQVTDATSAVFNAAPVGGGSNVVPVFCTGTAWLIG